MRAQLGSTPSYFAGRLANYLYIDMDDSMRQGLDTGAAILDDLVR